MEKKITSQRRFEGIRSHRGYPVYGLQYRFGPEELKPIQLLKPHIGSGSPLMQLLWKRMSLKEFSPEPAVSGESLPIEPAPIGTIPRGRRT